MNCDLCGRFVRQEPGASWAPDLLAAARLTLSAIESEHPGLSQFDDEYIYDTLGSALSGAYFALRAAIARANGAT